MTDNQNNDPAIAAEPLPIWFFVGLILLGDGLLVLLGTLFAPTHQTMLADLKPGLWWGAIIVVAGVVFLTIGVKTHKKS
ncbi:MAG: hypothetical protein WC889_19730 [Myxococcota bacterium]|jgi:hypothetical protein